MDRTVLITCCT